MGEAAERWRTALGAWAIPQRILEQATESPYGFSVDVFARAADDAATTATPSRLRALAWIRAGGSVLDVGCGAGAASLALLAHATRLVGVDEREAMLEAFSERCERHGVEHAEVHGRWPDVAPLVEVCDLVVCHHVFYNAPDLHAFADELDAHARVGVVCELTAHHPLAWMNPLWSELHGIERPDGPTAEDAAAVLFELGADVRVERFSGPGRVEVGTEATVEFVRRRLCLPPDRTPDVRAALEQHPPPPSRELVTLSWTPRRHGQAH
jgi:SAM-dependent methyltransferase